MRLPTADEWLVMGLFALLAFLAFNDANRVAFRPAWHVYIGLLFAILVVMGYSVDTASLSISPPTPRPAEPDDPRDDEADK